MISFCIVLVGAYVAYVLAESLRELILDRAKHEQYEQIYGKDGSGYVLMGYDGDEDDIYGIYWDEDELRREGERLVEAEIIDRYVIYSYNRAFMVNSEVIK